MVITVPTASLLMPLGATNVIFSSKPKFAVIVPVPLTAALADKDEELSKDIGPVELQDKNPYPLFKLACIESVPLFTHTFVPAGVVDPPAGGFETKETWYCA